MRRKVLALILLVALCMAFTSCGPKKSGKPYLNKKSPATTSDGFNYETEEDKTENFLCYKAPKGELKLFCLNSEKFYPIYDPDGLCDTEPGSFYKIRYDAQHVTGGIGGIHTATFLCVYSCEKIGKDNAFENGLHYYGSRFSSLDAEGIMSTGEYLITHAADGGYDLYSAGQSDLHYDEIRNLLIPVTADGKDRDTVLQLNIFCNKDQTDDYIMEHIKEGKAGDGSFLFADDHLTDPGPDVFHFESIENAATAYGWQFSTLRIFFDTDTPEKKRMFISEEDLSSKTAEELKIPEIVYDALIDKLNGLKRGAGFSQYFKGYLPQHYDCILFSGEIYGLLVPTYGKDIKINLSDYNYSNTDDPYTSSDDEPCQYAAVFIISDFNDIVPQD